MTDADTQRNYESGLNRDAATDTPGSVELHLPKTSFTSISGATDASIKAFNFADALGITSLNFTDLPIRPTRLTYEKTSDGNTHVGYRGNTAVYCQDATGEWDSTDGSAWVKRGTNGQRIWHGSVSVNENDDYTCVNSDSGVTTVSHNDRSTTTSMIGANGQRIEILKNEDGINVKCIDSSGTWTSSDGSFWTNTDTGDTNSSTARIDEFGRYLITVEGHTEVLGAQSRELEAVLIRQQRLTDLYGVRFPQPGEAKSYDSKDLTLRPPTIEELDCLSDMLLQNRQMDVRGMRFSFVQSSISTDNYFLWGVYQHTGHETKPDMLLFPRNTQIRGWDALEGTLQHELVHHEQYMRWGTGHWGGQGSNAEANQLMTDFGWIRLPGTGTYRIIDKDGGHWQNNTTSGRWEPVVDGVPVPGSAITSRAMRERALVRPSTNYFTQPWEMHAESMAMYRFHGRQLWSENSDLYDVMKRYDQREINRTLGTKHGRPRSIRGVDGDIVPNTAQNRRSVEEMEQSWSQLLHIPELVHRSGGCAHCRT